MSEVETPERSVRAEVAAIRASRADAIGAEQYPFVTISRQPGSGGQSLARTMLEVFARQDDVALFGGWHVFDRRLCEIVAEDPKLAGSLESLVTEAYRSRTEDFLRNLLTTTTDQSFVMEGVFRSVLTVAGMGKAIIVGRAGSQVTKGMDSGLSLRLVAPETVRVARLMERHGIDERAARDQARKRDAHRARLLRRHFRTDIDDPLGYDAVWNTAEVTTEEIAESVVAILRRRVTAR
jgi:cytidylate kinase